MMFQRHDLVYLSASGWQQVREQPGSTGLDAVRQWQLAGWPAIVRRNEQAQTGTGPVADGKISLGIALPPRLDGSKQRLALNVATSHIASVREPLDLVDAIPQAPPHWRQELGALDTAAKEVGISLQVFGSLAMQSLTGLSYLTPKSDIDILFRPDSSVQMQAGLALLGDFGRRLPLDGELVFPDAQAVAWKELAGYATGGNMDAVRVLCKNLHSVSLQPVSSLLAAFDEA
jgi:phosphoribosyl-dephospho-CoA transferase